MLPISRSSAYAIRALTYLSHRQEREGGFCLAREMARSLGIPAPFLGKVLQPLVTRGLLQSQRGRRGGFRLVVPPAKISLFEIVDSQEHLGQARPCFLGQAECADERPCPLHEFWKSASDSLVTELAGTSLADLLRFADEQPEGGYPLPLDRGPRRNPRRVTKRLR